MPNININATTILVFIGLVVGGFFLFFNRRSLDITSQKNIFAGPINKIISGQTGIEGDTLGTSLNRGVENLTDAFRDAVAAISPGDKLPSYFDRTQEWKTCMAIKRQRGFVRSQRCKNVIANEAPGSTSVYDSPSF